MSDLANKECVPCKGGVPPLKPKEAGYFLGQLEKGWKIVDNHHLQRNYPFDGFVDALAFVNRVGSLAEHQGHHPDLHLSWGLVGVEVWTHKIDGLTESDFILAAKIDELYKIPA